MASFKAVYNHDKTAAEEGVWADIGHGIKVKVRAFDSSHTKALRKKLQEPFAPLLRMGKDIAEDDQNEINIKLVAGSSLIDWNLTEEVNDAEGKLVEQKIPFSAATAEKFLREEPQFTRDVITVLMGAETFKKRSREEDAKNSSAG
jgi:hypothetical protein